MLGQTGSAIKAQWKSWQGKARASVENIRPWLWLTARSAARTASQSKLVEKMSFPSVLPCGRHCFSTHKRTDQITDYRDTAALIKGSVERSLLPWAVFLIFTRNRPWKSEDHLCTLFFIEMSKERLAIEKSERTPPVSWRPWALAYSRDRPYNFSRLSAVSKNRRFHSFFLGFGCHLPRKSLSWRVMPVSNKKEEFEQRKRIKLFDDFWVRAYRFDFAPRRRPRARSI